MVDRHALVVRRFDGAPRVHVRSADLNAVAVVAERIRSLASDRRRTSPVLVAVGGAVAVGKSTLAAALEDALGPLRVEVVATDGFLRPNEELAREGLLMVKGFPSTYDAVAIEAFVAALRAGRPATVPVYSHAVYDRVPGDVRTIDARDVVIVEGVNALQPSFADATDLAVYLHAEEPVVRSWYVARFVELVIEAETDEGSFYRRFVDLDDAARRTLAEMVWETVNLVNLTEHILPTRAAADVVLTKDADHRATISRAHLGTRGQP